MTRLLVGYTMNSLAGSILKDQLVMVYGFGMRILDGFGLKVVFILMHTVSSKKIGFIFDLNSINPKRYYNFAILAWVDLSTVNLEVQLDALKNQNSGNSSPNDIKRAAIKIVANSKLSEEQKRMKISSIILHGL